MFNHQPFYLGYERQKKKIFFYILGYITELIIKNWWFGFFLQILTILGQFFHDFFSLYNNLKSYFSSWVLTNFCPKETLVWMDQCCDQCEPCVCVFFLVANFSHLSFCQKSISLNNINKWIFWGKNSLKFANFQKINLQHATTT